MSNRYLPTALRRTLEKTIKEARVVAEEGASDAIRRLGVAQSKAPAYLSETDKDLRRRLRAHARALGDTFDRALETQETKKLVEGAAYAHWHRMLFARFLAERDLLRHPEHNVPVTIGDCRELAAAEGLSDSWAVAERYAAAMLPAVFRIDDPVLALELDPVHTQKLNRLVTDLDAEIFQVEDSLGWTYQFWRAAEKDAVNKSGMKIAADELPAVTQLFTEPYMVRFLLHNTLGAWWAGKRLATDPALAETAPDENALRAACSLPDYAFDMLRFVKEEAQEDNGSACWRPAAGTFPGWPKDAKAITMLDPCCGSGHFLTEALAILAALRQAEEDLSAAEAVSAVLRDNLYGLEIDGRCVQIAAFAVALTAWRIGGGQSLPLPHFAWVGAPPPLPEADFVALANGDAGLHGGLTSLHDLFVQAPTLGSLIEPRGGDLGDYWRLGNIEPLLDKLLAKAQGAEPEIAEGAIAARGMADAAAFLSRRYTLQATNVPFLGRGKQSGTLADFIGRVYPEAKSDLATAMLARMTKLASPSGTVAAVTPQNWLFLSSYMKLREGLIDQLRLNIMGALGSRAFETVSGEVVTVSLIALSAARPKSTDNFAGIDCNTARDHKAKEEALIKNKLHVILQKHIRDSVNSIISFNREDVGELISKYASVLVGVSTSDSPQYIFKFWEWVKKGNSWEYFQTTVRQTQL